MKRCIKGGFSVLSGFVGVVLLSSKMGFYCVTKCRQKSREPRDRFKFCVNVKN